MIATKNDVIPFFMVINYVDWLVPQIREQMSGPEISYYGKSILGCGPLVWAGLWNKRVWADYEQLLRPVFPLFRGQKNILKYFWKHHSVRTEKLHRKKVKKKIFFLAILWQKCAWKNTLLKLNYQMGLSFVKLVPCWSQVGDDDTFTVILMRLIHQIREQFFVQSPCVCRQEKIFWPSFV